MDWSSDRLVYPSSILHVRLTRHLLTDESGWVWFIPLAKNLVSVGIVMDHVQSIQKRKTLRKASGNSVSSLQDIYLHQLKLAPGLSSDLIPNAKLVEKEGGPLVRQASDYSYSATEYAGPGYRLVGDAACQFSLFRRLITTLSEKLIYLAGFIDPFFSSGVHLALTGALSAAGTIASSIRDTVTEEECATWHNTKVSVAYTRFLLVVLGSYKQMKAQRMDVLSNVSEDNFDRAFDLIRPSEWSIPLLCTRVCELTTWTIVIQGTADVNKKVTEDEVERTMDFIKNILFIPTTPELEADVRRRVDPKFFEGGEASILLPTQVEALFEEEDIKHVLDVANARKPIHKMFDTERDFASEPINGYTVRLVRGKLGIIRPEGMVAA